MSYIPGLSSPWSAGSHSERASRGRELNTPGISSRIEAVRASPIARLEQQARDLKAAGEHVISFAAGEPDFSTPSSVVEAAVRACRDPQMHHYTPVAGLPELRQAVAAGSQQDPLSAIGPENVLVTSGTKQAISHALETLLDPGDEVLLPAPYWPTYPEAIRIAGGTAVVVRTSEAQGFRVGAEQLESQRSERTKAVIFVSPSNPTGAVYGREQIAELGHWALTHGLWVVCDEIYEHFTYDGAEFHSMPVVVTELRDRAIRVNGVAKTYAMTGWRVGWLIGSHAVVDSASNLQSHVCGNISNIAQRAALAALGSGPDSTADMRATFERRRSIILDYMDRLPGFECPRPQGAFYVFPSVTGLMGRQVRGNTIETSEQLAAVMLDEVGLAVVPGEVFGAPEHLRFSYALGDDDLADGMERLTRLLS